jgi:FkbM family methyltransferase
VTAMSNPQGKDPVSDATKMQRLKAAWKRYRNWTSHEAAALRRLRHKLDDRPRRTPGEIDVWGWRLEYVDAASLISAFDYIVVRKWIDFIADTPQPRILDCGANIGISVMHSKRLYPEARITAFEADPVICEVLRRNLTRNGILDVEIVEAALWNRAGWVQFESEGADSGRIRTDLQENASVIRVRAERLAPYLEKPVDLLKLDIEGAEGAVLADCSEVMAGAKRVIIEYHCTSGKAQDLSGILALLEKGNYRYLINSDGFWRGFSHFAAAPEGWLDHYLMIYAQREDAAGCAKP